MSLSWRRIRTVARRDYLYTVRRRAFVFTLVGLPLLYAVLFTWVFKRQMTERTADLKAFTALGVVDSSGLFVGASRAVWTDLSGENPFASARTNVRRDQVRTEVKTYPDQPAGESALRAGTIRQLVVLPRDYSRTGSLRRYATDDNVFTSGDQIVSRWITRGLLNSLDSTRVEMVTQPLRHEALYTLNREGRFELKDEARQTLDFLLPFALGLLLGLAIVIGGQYMLQGMGEEKESRILESMLSNVGPEELLAGKLLGLGGAGLTLVAGWILLMVAATGSAATASGLLKVSLSPFVIVIMLVYFLLGYLFYGSLMMGIGAIASTMREAQQFSIAFTFMTFVPFYNLSTLIGHPDSSLAVGLSLFPPTAPVSSMLRLAAPGSHVPAWQITLSLLLLGGSAWLIVLLSARLFRIGMLLYGKTPNLPEILRGIRQAV